MSLTLTDLIGMWSCSLDATAIVDYARAHRTSIDPSESRSQYQILFQKLAQSLGSGTNTLYRRDDGGDTLVMETQLELPSPLRPLIWRFELEIQSGTAISQHILRPCLHEATLSHSKLESLLDVIKTKDQIISKLVEKIESANLDFSLIFPGITGVRARKGQATLRDARRHVTGLSAFDIEKWDTKFGVEDGDFDFKQKGLANLMGGLEKCPGHDVDGHEKWLEDLDVFDQDDYLRMTNSSDAPQKENNSDSDSARTASATESEDESMERAPSLKANREESRSSEDDFEPDTRSSKRIATDRPSVQSRSRSTSLPPLRPEISRNSTSSPDSSGSLSTTKRPLPTPKLGKLGAKPAETKSKPATKRQAALSSSPLPAPRLSSTPPAPSHNDSQTGAPPSTGRRRPPNRANGRLGSSDVASSPSTNTASASDLPSTPQRRLGKLKPTIPSSPLKLRLSHSPDHHSHRPENETSPSRRQLTRQDSTQISEPPTPSRRLGRLKRIQSQSQPPAPKSSQIAFNRLDSLPGTKHTAATGIDEDPHDEHPVNHDDASTSSSSSPTNLPSKIKTEQSEISLPPPPPPEPEPVATEEEKAAIRREELKRKTASAAPAAVRKKRKF